MSSHQRMADAAKRQIEKHGRVVTLIKKSMNSYSPSGGNVIGETIEPISAVFTSYKTSQIDGTNILQGDKSALVSCVANLHVNDVIEDTDGVKWTIVKTNKIQPGDVGIIYKPQLRR